MVKVMKMSGAELIDREIRAGMRPESDRIIEELRPMCMTYAESGRMSPDPVEVVPMSQYKADMKVLVAHIDMLRRQSIPEAEGIRIDGELAALRARLEHQG